MAKKLTLEDCQKTAKKRGGKCLSAQYKNVNAKLLWECEKNHKWEAKYCSVNNGNSWCPECSGKQKLTLENCQMIAEERGGKCISTEYKNNKTKMLWKCERNHFWETSFGSIKNRNSWCPECSKTQKLTLEDCQKTAETRGGKCISTEYKNSKTKMLWECEKNHKWKAKYSSVKNRNSWCLECSGKQKHTLEICQKIAGEKGGKCLSSQYKNSNTKMLWECRKTHKWKATFSNVKNNNSWCLECSGKQKHTLEICQKIAEGRGGKCLSTQYKNKEIKMLWECRKKHKWETTFGNIKNQNQWCSECAGNKKLTLEICQKIAEKKNGKCLSTEYKNIDTKILWECEKGHKWEAIFNSIKNQNSWCPECLNCPSCGLFRSMKKLCSYCKPQKNNKNYRKTKEWKVVNYLRKMLPDYPFVHNKSVGSDCTKNDREHSNGHLFPDIRFECGKYDIVVEVDEFKHRGADYKCDERRMYDIIAKLGVPCIFIRYNPDSENSDEKILLKTIKKYLECDDKIWNEHGFYVEYLFY